MCRVVGGRNYNDEVNAATHRSYSISGTEIQVKMFVDRMCRELEEAGLHDPKYFCDAFILKTIICNADGQKLAIGEEKLAIGEEKLAIEYIKLAIAKQNYKKPTEKNILKIYENIDTNQIFGTSEIAKILGCSASSARILMEKLRRIKVVCEVKGKGKGKYRFLNK